MQTQAHRPRTLGELLGEARRRWRRQALLRSGLALPEALRSCLGPERAAAIGFAGLSPRGTLTLTVEGSALLAELNAFHREPLLAALRVSQEGARVLELRFVPSGGADAR